MPVVSLSPVTPPAPADRPTMAGQPAETRRTAPYDTAGLPSPRAVLFNECRLCFTVAAICAVIGVAAGLIAWLAGRPSTLTALLIVGGLYALMGVGRLVKALRISPTGD